MRIAHVLLGRVGSVSELALFPSLGDLLNEQAALGHEVHAVSRGLANATGPLGAATAHLVETRGGPLLPPTRASLALALRVRGLRPDVLHVHGLLFPAQVALLRALVPARLAVQHHGEPPRERAAAVVAKAFRSAMDVALFTAREQAVEFTACGQISPKVPVVSVPETGTTFRRAPEDEAVRRADLRGAPAILWVGRLHDRKDPYTALEAFALLVRSAPSAHLTMVFGEAPHRAAVEARIAELALSERVTLRGRIEHASLPDFYSECSAFFTASPKEGSNYALIEALACGAIPVFSDIAPHRALTKGLGYAFPPGDARAAGRALVEAVTVGARLRDRILAHAAATLTWPAVARLTVEAYSARS